MIIVIAGLKFPDYCVEPGTAGDTHGDLRGHPKGLFTERERRVVDVELSFAHSSPTEGASFPDNMMWSLDLYARNLH
jgi:hypothetical protein